MSFTFYLWLGEYRCLTMPSQPFISGLGPLLGTVNFYQVTRL